MKSEIADICLNEGANIINDVTGYRFDNEMPNVISRNNAAVIINHTSDLPNLMQSKTKYKNKIIFPPSSIIFLIINNINLILLIKII